MENRFIQLGYNFYNLSEVGVIRPYINFGSKFWGVIIYFKEKCAEPEIIFPGEFVSDYEAMTYIKNQMKEVY